MSKKARKKSDVGKCCGPHSDMEKVFRDKLRLDPTESVGWGQRGLAGGRKNNHHQGAAITI